MKNRKNARFASTTRQWVALLLLVVHVSSCLHDHPERMDNGEIGIDPTRIQVTAQLTVHFDLQTNLTIRRTSKKPHRLRLTVEVHAQERVAARQVLYKEVEPGAEQTNLSIPLQLHAQRYQLAVWADYVSTDSDENPFYDTQQLDNIGCKEPYVGNNANRDAFFGTASLDLTPYRYQWQAMVPVQLEMIRPLARYNLVATDLAAFLQQWQKGEIAGKEFTATVRYGFYLPMGFNVLKGKVSDSKTNIRYSQRLSFPTEATKEFCIGFDYLLVNADDSFVSLTVEITNEQGKLVARLRGVEVPYRRGYATTVRGQFLTAPPLPGIEIDPDYDGDIQVDLDKI